MLRCVVAMSTDVSETLPEDAPSFGDRVGGRWVISWQAYTLGATVNSVLLSLTGGSLGAEVVARADVHRWLLVGAIASGVVGLYALLMNGTAFRNKRRRPSPLSAVVAFHSSVGAIFAGVVVVVAPLLGVSPPSPEWTFIIATSGIGLWWGLTMALLFEARERFRLRRRELLERAVDQELTALAEADITDELEERVLAEVTATLDASRQELADRIAVEGLAETTSETWEELAGSLRETAMDSVRPLSHRLWSSAEQRFPTPKVFDVVQRTVREPRTAPLASSLIVVIGYLRAGVDSLGLIAGALAVVAMAAIVSLIMLAGRWMQARARAAEVVIFWCAFLAAELVGLVFLRALSPDLNEIEIAGSVVAMAISVLAPAIVASLNETRQETLLALQESADYIVAQRLAREKTIAAFSRSSAEHLHGTVQTTLNACAAAMDQAVATADTAGFTRAVDRALAILSAEGVGVRTNVPQEALSPGLARCCGQWFGLLDISLNLCPESTPMPGTDATDRVVRIVEECLANASRHGQARSVEIHVRVIHSDSAPDSPSGPSYLDVVVTDDGGGLDDERGMTEGLGTHLLKANASGGYSRSTPPEGGCRVHARVLIEDQASSR